MVQNRMISVAEALTLISENRPPNKVRSVPVRECLGLRAAEDVVARVTMPPFDASAMDGYAVKLEDVGSSGVTLEIIGEAPAGSPFEGKVGQGQAVRIYTGGVMPDGADHVVIQEDTTRQGNQVIVNESFERSAHIRRAGIDFKTGDVLISKGVRLAPEHVALAASGNHAEIVVYERPKIAFISNGDELREPGSTLAPGEIINSNPAVLSALAHNWGAETVYTGCAGDSLESIKEHIASAREADIIVPIGGASVGDYDFMKQAFSDAGFSSVFKKIAVKPGKPTWFSESGGQRVLGLPGNPASAYVCAHLFLRPLLDRYYSPHWIKAGISEHHPANGPRENYMRGRLNLSHDGLTVEIFPRQDSSLMTPLRDSNVLIRLPANAGPWQEGDILETLPLSSEGLV